MSYDEYLEEAIRNFRRDELPLDTSMIVDHVLDVLHAQGLVTVAELDEGVLRESLEAQTNYLLGRPS